MPKSPGVYFFKNADGDIIYIGKAKSLRNRVASYFSSTVLLPRTAALVHEIAAIECIVTQSEIDAFLLEANMIRKFAPRYNVNWKDGKSYPLIEITLKDKIPTVIIVRQENNPKATYFGPYPTGSDLFSLLRFLRRVFPFVSQNHPRGKPCLRSHLGLCPCPGIFADEKLRQKYRTDIRNLVAFLQGKRTSLQKKLTREMNLAARNEDFEEAGRLKRQLEQIAYVTASRTLPWDYEVNPNLTTDRQQQSLLELQKILNLPQLSKIEGYDISNTSGKLATGAQVVFIDGQPEKSLYRRYRIKRSDSPDDYAMLAEMLSRRFLSDIKLPELMMIDGGAGQVSRANNEVSSWKMKKTDRPPYVIGLAKRRETIFLPDGQTIQLPLTSAPLQLLQQVRDEAHHFSRKYHFHLRRRKLLSP